MTDDPITIMDDLTIMLIEIYLPTKEILLKLVFIYTTYSACFKHT